MAATKRKIQNAPVVVKDYRTDTWRKAIVEEQCSPVTYTVRTNDDRSWKRHVDQMKPRLPVYEQIPKSTNAFSVVKSDMDKNKCSENSRLADDKPLTVREIKSEKVEVTKPKPASEIESKEADSRLKIRKSQRMRKPLQKLDL